MAKITVKESHCHQLVSHISDTFVTGQKSAVLSVNSHLVETYWKIGQYIVEYEQGGNVRAEYGKKLLEQLSKDLSLLHGKGNRICHAKYFFSPLCVKIPTLFTYKRRINKSY